MIQQISEAVSFQNNCLWTLLSIDYVLQLPFLGSLPQSNFTTRYPLLYFLNIILITNPCNSIYPLISMIPHITLLKLKVILVLGPLQLSILNIHPSFHNIIAGRGLLHESLQFSGFSMGMLYLLFGSGQL